MLPDFPFAMAEFKMMAALIDPDRQLTGAREDAGDS
jgi:hypothetical protein